MYMCYNDDKCIDCTGQETLVCNRSKMKKEIPMSSSNRNETEGCGRPPTSYNASFHRE